MLRACLFLLLMLCIKAHAQNLDGVTFKKARQFIDSACNNINNDTSFKRALVELSKDEGFVAQANVYYTSQTGEVQKFIYTDYENGVATSTFYFRNGKLIKVEDGNDKYYSLDGLRDANGNTVPASLADNLKSIPFSVIGGFSNFLKHRRGNN